jgi:hypothetical protein
MEIAELCQSCGMPISAEEHRGTEKNGSGSSLYCKYCFQDGELTRPGISFEEMEKWVRERLEESGANDSLIWESIGNLTRLKRWHTDPHIL